tara:strand:+ start:52 stop:618 length:567 start_codon:yes stop_codon:yes gene_type:complete
MIYSMKNGEKVYYITPRDVSHNAYLEKRLRNDIENYTNFIASTPDSTPDQRKGYFDKVVRHVSYSTQMVEYAKAGMEGLNWVELLNKVLELMDAEIATLDMSDYHQRIMIAHPWQWVRGNIVKSRDECMKYFMKTQAYQREVMRTTFLYGCASQNSGSTTLPLIGARYAYGPIRKQIAEYVGAISASV